MSQVKVLLAMTGLDPNNKRIRLLARTIKDTSGIEVHYSGMYKSLEDNAAEAVRLQVDMVGLSIYTGLHLTVFPDMRRALDAAGGADIALFGEGLIPAQDAEALVENGAAAAIFPATAPINSIIEWILHRPG